MKDWKLSVRVLLGGNRGSGKDIHPLTIRVGYRRHKKEFSLGVRVHVSNFCEERERVVFSPAGNLKRKELGAINRLIARERGNIGKIFLQLQRERPGFDVGMLVERYHTSRGMRYVETFFSREIEKLEAEGRQGTADQYRSGLYSLLRFTGERKLCFRDIDPLFVSEYIHFLRKRPVTDNTVNMYLRILRAVYNKAYDRGIETGGHSPFRDIRVRGQETLKRALTGEEIFRIASADLSGKPLMEQARDLFMFSFYTRGMPFVDIIHLRDSSIVNGVISYERNKTGQPFRVRVIKPLEEIIGRYRSPHHPYVMPQIVARSAPGRSSYTSYRYALGSVNRMLKQLGKQLGIRIPLTTYVARHSWATIAKREGFSVASISESLGHTSESTTRTYLQSFDNEIIDRINEQVAERVLNPEKAEENTCREVVGTEERKTSGGHPGKKSAGTK